MLTGVRDRGAILRRRIAAVGLVLLLLMVGPWGPGAQANGGCVGDLTAGMLVPVPTSGPPPFPLSGIHIGFEDFAGLWVYVHQAWITNIGHGTTFYLWPTGGGNVAGQQMPDFNVAFYKDLGNGNTQLIETFNEVGPDTGEVPSGADRALVWMRTGPESPLDDDGNPFGAEFNYRDQCGRPPGPFK